MQIFRANIIYTPESHRFEVIPHGFVAVSDGKVEGVWQELPAHLADIPVTDWGDRLLERLERFVYVGDDRHIVARYCQGCLIPDPWDDDNEK